MKSGRTGKGVAKKSERGVRSPRQLFYDSKAGILTATVMSLMLWWVPYLGPMAAGFMGGRKGGSIPRAIIVGAVSCVLVLLITGLLSVGVSALYAGDYAESVQGMSMVLYDALGALSEYLETFIVVTDTGFEFDQSTYFLVIGLSVIGGVFAEQSRKELEAITEYVKDKNKAKTPRSLKDHMENREWGFRTYDDYARMSVNVSQVADSKPVEKKAPQPKPQPVETTTPEPAVRIQQTQIPNTVPTSSISSSTVTETVPDKKKTTTVVQTQTDDYEFL